MRKRKTEEPEKRKVERQVSKEKTYPDVREGKSQSGSFVRMWECSGDGLKTK